MVLLHVFKAFNRRHVRYLVIGGVAVTLYGHPRFTKDLDIFPDPEEGNLEKLIRAMKALGFVPRVPVKAEEFILKENRDRWIREKGMRVFTFVNPKKPIENVDIMIDSPLSFSEAYRRKRTLKGGTISIPTVSRADLIRMKKFAGRPQDLQDIEILRYTAHSRKKNA